MAWERPDGTIRAERTRGRLIKVFDILTSASGEVVVVVLLVAGGLLT